MNNNPNYLTAKTTITNIEKCFDKNSHHYFKITTNWEQITRLFYAFSVDFNLQIETLKELTNSPQNFLNRLCLITYREQTHKDGNGSFANVKQIQIAR